MGVFKRWIFESSNADMMLSRLEDDFQARYTQPPEFNANNNSHTMLRLVAADALDDDDRTEEANLLRNLQQHVVVVDGQVYRGGFFYRTGWEGRLNNDQIVSMRRSEDRVRNFIRRVDAAKAGTYHYYAGGMPSYYEIQGNTGYFNDMFHVNSYRLFFNNYNGYARLVHTREQPVH